MLDFFCFFKNYMFQFFITMLLAYLIGSISFATIFTKLFDKEDIRDLGSKNAGFTNVLRSANKKAAILTFIFDFLKGAAAVNIGHFIFEYTVLDATETSIHIGIFLAGFACILGHIYPCFFGFRGGKGVLTSAAIILMVDYRIFILLVASFLICFIISKIISLSSIVAAISLPFISFFVTYVLDYLPNKFSYNLNFNLFYVFAISFISLCMSSIVIWKHRSNIKRLLKGEEKKITVKGKE